MGRNDRPKFLRRFTPTQIRGDKMTSLVYTGIITLPLGGSDALAAGEGRARTGRRLPHLSH